MDKDVIAIFLIAFFAIVLTFGFFFVRARTRDVVITLWGMHARAQNPAAYWFWSIWYIVGTVWFGFAVFAVTAYFVVDILTS